MLRIAFDWHDEYCFRLVGVNIDRKTEIGRQIAADFVPDIAGIVAAHHVPVFLHEQHVGSAGMKGDAVDAVADFGVRIGNVVANAIPD